MPIRNVGSETPSSEIVMKTWLRKVPRRSAEYTPIGMPISSARSAATSASSSVAGKRSRDQARNLGALAQAQAEFALRRIDQEMPELHEEGLVQPQVGAQLADLLRRGVLPQQEDHGVADILEQQERDERDCDHDNHGLDQAAQDKGEHRICAYWCCRC